MCVSSLFLLYNDMQGSEKEKSRIWGIKNIQIFLQSYLQKSIITKFDMEYNDKKFMSFRVMMCISVDTY